jgi:hypothetical protein
MVPEIYIYIDKKGRKKRMKKTKNDASPVLL